MQLEKRHRSPTAISEAAFVRRVLIVALIAAAIGVAWVLTDVILLFFGAVLVAVTLRAIGAPFSAAGMSNTAAVSAAALFIVAVLTAAIMFFGAEIAAQSQNLSSLLSTAVTRLSEQIGISSLEEMLRGVNPAADIAPLIPRFLSWSISLGGALFSLALVTVGGIYLALDPHTYREGFVKLVPPSFHANANATLDDIGEALHRWVGGQLVAMIIVGSLSGTGLWLAGVQSPLALGLIAGLSNFVPYLGAIAAAAITLIIASAQGLETFLWAAAVMFFVQQIESNIVTPVVVGGAVSLSPVTGLFAIVAMAVLFGPLGVLFGFPLAIVADIAIRRLYIRDALDEPVEILGDQAQKSSVVGS